MSLMEEMEIRNNLSRLLYDLDNKIIVGADVVDFVVDIMKDQEKAFGGCNSCFGKGYSTYRHGIEGADDFASEGFKDPIKNHIIYCTCERGKQLEEMNNVPKG